jgi:hypothetical protein
MMMTIGAANSDRPLHHAVDELAPEAVLDLFAGLVFCTRAPSQCSHQLVGFQLRKNGTRRNEYTPRVDVAAQSPRQAGSTVIDRIADKHDRGDHGVGE